MKSSATKLIEIIAGEHVRSTLLRLQKLSATDLQAMSRSDLERAAALLLKVASDLEEKLSTCELDIDIARFSKVLPTSGTDTERCKMIVRTGKRLASAKKQDSHLATSIPEATKLKIQNYVSNQKQLRPKEKRGTIYLEAAEKFAVSYRKVEQFCASKKKGRPKKK